MSYIQPGEDSKPAALMNVEAEQVLLGTVLTVPDAIARIGSLGRRELFADPVHGDIWDKCVGIAEQGGEPNPVMLGLWADQDARLKEIGGRGYLFRLQGVSSVSVLDDVAAKLNDLRARRALQEAASIAIEDVRNEEEPVIAIAGRLETALLADTTEEAAAPASALAATTEAVGDIIAAQRGDKAPCVPTGIGRLDGLITGLWPGHVTIIGGRPGMGKTVVALDIALNVSAQGQGVIFASLEMTAKEMMTRAISRETSNLGNAIAYKRLLAGDFSGSDIDTFTQAADIASSRPLHFLPWMHRDPGSILTGVRQVQRKLDATGTPLGLIVVDYIQLMEGPGRDRLAQITAISIALKKLAMRLNVPVLAVSQLSRAVESRDDKRPVLSDLRESGQLEQDASTILFAYREAYYHEREKPDIDDLEAMSLWMERAKAIKNNLEIIVAKQRNGETATALLNCNPATNLIWEW
ncbi:MAG: DnaB-like helicase C-terminal domain-containing protein [Pseudomonadota bacterium]